MFSNKVRFKTSCSVIKDFYCSGAVSYPNKHSAAEEKVLFNLPAQSLQITSSLKEVSEVM